MENIEELLKNFKETEPKYETILPYSNKKALFTPFKVKDAKKIALILQENDKKLGLLAMYEILKNNSTNINVEELCLADAEHLFLQIRSKSVEELLNVIVNGKKYKIQISEISSLNSIQDVTVELNEKVFLHLQTPTLKQLIKKETFTPEVYSKSCIKSISINGQIFYVDKFLNKEAEEFINNLPLLVIEKIKGFVEKEPKLFFKLEEGEVSGLLSFFT